MREEHGGTEGGKWGNSEENLEKDKVSEGKQEIAEGSIGEDLCGTIQMVR